MTHDPKKLMELPKFVERVREFYLGYLDGKLSHDAVDSLRRVDINVVLDAALGEHQLERVKAEREGWVLPAEQLCNDAESMLEAANNLWWSHNPDADIEGTPPREEEAQEVHSERFQALQRAVYYMRKAISKSAPQPGKE